VLLLLLPQAACTPKELKELVTMPSIAISARPEQMAVSEADMAEMKAVRLKRRIVELISKVRRSLFVSVRAASSDSSCCAPAPSQPSAAGLVCLTACRVLHVCCC
jgi:hypothetical protein